MSFKLQSYKKVYKLFKICPIFPAILPKTSIAILLSHFCPHGFFRFRSLICTFAPQMQRLIDCIVEFLEENGIVCSVQERCGLEVVCAMINSGENSRIVVPVEILADNLDQARAQSCMLQEAVTQISHQYGYPIIIPQDRWHRQRTMMQARLLSHMGVFSPAYARNCEVRRITKEEAQQFLADNHSYGYALSKYCYGLFLKRHTGHIAQQMQQADRSDNLGQLIAVATFSKARRWVKGDREILSYEWVRYASLPQMRLSGGMGKLLKSFIADIKPDDVMSYADLEWSEGDVYARLGFQAETLKGSVDFEIDPATWERLPIRTNPVDLSSAVALPKEQSATKSPQSLYYTNLGGRKYRLKLTDYQ